MSHDYTNKKSHRKAGTLFYCYSEHIHCKQKGASAFYLKQPH